MSTQASPTTGDWILQLDGAWSFPPSPLTFQISGNLSTNVVMAHNVTFGDVFFCSGQSNMVYPLKLALNVTQQVESLQRLSQQGIHFTFFMTSRGMANHSQFDLPTPSTGGECDTRNHNDCNQWIPHPQALANKAAYLLDFSAVCFLTVRDIVQLHLHETKRPVALIQAAWSGTRIEAWMSPDSIAKTQYASRVPVRANANHASVLYHAMIHPWNSFAIRAALWYQGESNAVQIRQMPASICPVDYYATLYQSMIADWRDAKGMGDFAWGTVQLPPSVASGTSAQQQATTGRMEIRMAEDLIGRPHVNGTTDIVALAVTLDLGGSGAWGIDHPPNKNEISRRLALGLLHAAYGLQTPLWTGPILESIGSSSMVSNTYRSNNNNNNNHKATIEIRLLFSYSGEKGMNLRDVQAVDSNGTRNDCHKCCSEAPPFEILMEDQWRTVPRRAITIQDETVILTIPTVLDLHKRHVTISAAAAAVTAVRYAWTDYVECVLENSDGLVASPFVRDLIPPPLQKQRHKTSIHLRRPHYKKKPLQSTTATRSSLYNSHQPNTQTTTTAASSSPFSPPMGFNSWNFYHCNIDENTVKAIADAMVQNGMKEVGYRYVNIDDCWQVQRSPKNGVIQEDPARFPSGIKALADYVHSKGLLLGLYTAQGSNTCQHRPGSYGYEEIDAQTYCDWGIDYLKDDDCDGTKWPQTNTSWIKFRSVFDKCQQATNHSTILSVEYCRSVEGCGEWIAETANVWRTTDDIENNWESVMHNIHAQEPMYKIARPGHFNDPDILQVGNIGGLTIPEQYSHMALWCIAGAPLLIGTDLIHASNTTLAILTNAEVTSVNQDLGWQNQVQGRIIRKSDRSEVWGKRLQDGSWALVLLNLMDNVHVNVTVAWQDIRLPNSTKALVRDLWEQKDLGVFVSECSVSNLAPHESRFLRIVPQDVEDDAPAVLS